MIEYHTYGDRFYIILEGSVSVRQPKEVKKTFDLSWDLYNFILQEYDNIRNYKDDESKTMG